MGTRNLSGVFVNGEWRIAKYCQWDGYPSGVGLDILKTINNIDLFDLKEKIINNAVFVTNDEVKSRYAELGIDSHWISLDESDRFAKKWPLLVREASLANIIKAFYHNPNNLKIETKNGIDFANDSLFCEYAYFIDFDKNTFEVYRGFNQHPLEKDERFFKENVDDNGYYPVKIWKIWSLDNLPNEEDFLIELNEENEEILNSAINN